MSTARHKTHTVEWRVVFLLAGGGTWRVSGIARRLGENKSRIERVVRDLVASGWPLRSTPDDGHRQARRWSMVGSWTMPTPPRRGERAEARHG